MEFTITKNDRKNINKAIKSDNPWNEPCIANFKARIKKHLLANQDEQCCYCKKNLHGEFLMVIDIEHILPKSKYKSLTFNPKNLALACKRCNMKVKKDSIEFIANIDESKKNPFHPENYKFIHPNSENFYDYISFHSISFNQHRLIKYNFNKSCKKSQYTYDFFKLKELEIEKLNLSQGLKIESLDEISPHTDLQNELEFLIETLKN